jgi:hypothetical protein
MVARGTRNPGQNGRNYWSAGKPMRSFAVHLDAFDQLLMLNIPPLYHPRRALAVLLGRNDSSTDPTGIAITSGSRSADLYLPMM